MRFENSGVLSYARTTDGLRSNLDTMFPSMLPLGMRGVVLKDTGRLIGDCGLHRLETVGGNPVEITYHLARAYWNQGYATEAARCLLTHGFMALGLWEIVAAINPENVASARVAQNLGLRPDRRIEWPKQGLVDLYVITRDQYGSQHE
jgi:RimJ/RimL family protein N-acetyltransferase